MKFEKPLVIIIGVISSIFIIGLTTNFISSQYSTIAPRLLLAAQQQGILSFPTSSPPPAEVPPSITPIAPSISTTPTVQTSVTPSPGSQISTTPNPQTSQPIAPSPIATISAIGGNQTRQTDWVYEGTGLCWSSWSGNQCTLQSHEGGATSVARDLNKDGTPDITCSQGNGSSQSTTVTNTSSQPITISCERYECNSCSTGNGTHSQCDGSIDPNSNRISEPVVVAPGCSLTCTFAGVINSCGSTTSPTFTPQPSLNPSLSTIPSTTTQPSVPPTVIPTILPTGSPSTPPGQEENIEIVKSVIEKISIDNIKTIIGNLQDDDEVAGADALQTRYAGTNGNITEATYIKTQLENYGFEVTEQKFNQVQSVLTGFTCPNGTNMNNISAKITGSNPSNVYMMVGHYDSISEAPNYDPAPGADDNASGTAVILEIARVLAQTHSQKPFTHTIELVLFDAEELGLCGSSYYVSQLSDARKESIKGVINIDMIGFSPTSQTCSLINYHQTDTRSLLLAKQLAATNDRYGISTTGKAQASSAKNSDHASFWNVNIPAIAVYECYIENNPDYHKTTDTLESINLDQIEYITKSIAATMTEFGLDMTFEALPTNSVPTTAQPTTVATQSPNPSVGACTLTGEEDKLVQLINQYRQGLGLPNLAVDCRLTEAARKHSQDAAALNTDQTDNTSPHCTGGIGNGATCPQGTVFDRVSATGYRFDSLAENVTQNTQAEAILSVWKGSTGHNNVLTSTVSTQIGVGISNIGATAVFGLPSNGYVLSPPGIQTKRTIEPVNKAQTILANLMKLAIKSRQSNRNVWTLNFGTNL